MKDKAKLAVVAGKMKGGGVESTVMQYLRCLDQERFDLTLIVDQDSTLVPEQELSDLGVHLVWVPPYQNVLTYHRALYRLFRDEKMDIVHTHINTLNVFPMFAAKRANVPVRIAHNHATSGKGETKRNIAKYMLRPFAKVFPTTFCACGQYAGQWIYGKRSDFFVMPNSIDFCREDNRFSAEIREGVRKELGLSERFVIGHVGRFIQQKNHAFLIKIFAEVLKKKPDAVLLLVGSGDLLKATQEQAQKLGISDHVIFAGQREDTVRLYQAMDTLVFPSLYEGKPLVPVEAQMSGLPVLSADTVTREIVYDEALVHFQSLSESAEVWADKVIEMAEQDRERRTIDIDLSKHTVVGRERYVSAEELSDWYYEVLRHRIQ